MTYENGELIIKPNLNKVEIPKPKVKQPKKKKDPKENKDNFQKTAKEIQKQIEKEEKEEKKAQSKKQKMIIADLDEELIIPKPKTKQSREETEQEKFNRANRQLDDEIQNLKEATTQYNNLRKEFVKITNEKLRVIGQEMKQKGEALTQSKIKTIRNRVYKESEPQKITDKSNVYLEKIDKINENIKKLARENNMMDVFVNSKIKSAGVERMIAN